MSRARIFLIGLGSRLTLKAGSCLLVEAGSCILVDPGALGSAAEVDQAIHRACGLGLKDVTLVFYTHLHFDHYGPEVLELTVTDIVVPREEYEFVSRLMLHRHQPEAYRRFLLDSHTYIAPVFLRQFGRLAQDSRYDFDHPALRGRLRLVTAGERLSPAMRTVALAGHCPGQLGLTGLTQWGKTVIAGDAALSLEDFHGRERLLIVYDRQQLADSKRRLATADCIVPSHGAWFHPQQGLLPAREKESHE